MSEALQARTAARLRAAGCVFAEDEARLLHEAADGDDLEDLVGRRVAGQPLEPLLGWVDFAGLRLTVRPGVFVPRRRTELLARHAVAATLAGCVMVELCCGCAAVAAVVRHAHPTAQVHAADVDPVAVACARVNLPGDPVWAGDLFDALPDVLRGAIGVLVANAPYVPTGEIGMLPPEARDHEPRVALDGGVDGVDVHRRIAEMAPSWLAPGGVVLVETSLRQSELTMAAFADAGLSVDVTTDAGSGTCVVRGTLPT